MASLLQSAMGNVEDGSPNAGGKIQRATAAYTPTYQRFVVKQKGFTHQYSHIYTRRTLALRDLVLSEAKRRWQTSDGGYRLNIVDGLMQVGVYATTVGRASRQLPIDGHCQPMDAFTCTQR